MGVIRTYDTCIRDCKLLLVIFMVITVISEFPRLPVARDCRWLPVHWFCMVIMLISGYCSNYNEVFNATSNENANHLKQYLNTLPL